MGIHPKDPIIKNPIVNSAALLTLSAGLFFNSGHAAENGLAHETAQVKKDSVEVKNDRKDIRNNKADNPGH